jgi:hypothetical protein
MRLVSTILGSALAATALIGALHLPGARALLMATGGCPIPAEAALSPAEADARRVASVSMMVGEGTVEPVTPQGLTLGQTDAAALVSWAAARGGTCGDAVDGRGLSCEGVAVDGLESTVNADLDASRRVVSLSILGRPADPDAATAAFSGLRSALSPLGDPSRDVGEDASGWLAGGVARQRRVEWRRANLFTRLSVTHMGGGRYVLSQVYQSVGG